ncbi:MAG TPA: cytochrome c oxidase assembly factor Coa1 family protein [Rhodanobacteraceae bacterium]
MTARPHPGWLRRHWHWLLASACAVAACGIVAAIIAFMALLSGYLRTSTPFQHAMQMARSNAAVALALGDPIRSGWFVTGHLRYDSDGGGEAEFRIPLHGSRRSGTLRVEGEFVDGHWQYTILSVRVDATGRRIDLLGVPWRQAKCRIPNAINCNTIKA